MDPSAKGKAFRRRTTTLLYAADAPWSVGHGQYNPGSSARARARVLEKEEALRERGGRGEHERERRARAHGGRQGPGDSPCLLPHLSRGKKKPSAPAAVHRV